MDGQTYSLLHKLKVTSVVTLFVCFVLSLSGCDDHPWNDPYPNQSAKANVLYSAFSEQPKHLDPAKSYSANEWQLIAQIYEPPLEYNYLKRPYELQGLTASEMPSVKYDPANNTSTYIIKIKQGINYQPHPAFARHPNGNLYYHDLKKQNINKYNSLNDFKYSATRELIAADYVYQIKRLADPTVNSPIFGFMTPYIHDLDKLRNQLTAEYKNNTNKKIDLRNIEFAGAYIIDQYTYAIVINGKYPQFEYWLAMPFFAPMPWEAIEFYAQPGLAEHNITLDWYPVGTGAFYLIENNPDRRMVLSRNPYYHEDYYPSTGTEEDIKIGLLESAGKKLPFIDQAVFSLEKENIPYWDKFTQGYYDISGISSDNFNSAISSSSNNGIELTEELKSRGVRLQITNTPAIFYWAFNMLDPSVGGNTERARLLRTAIALAFDMDEYVMIFTNGRGIVAQGPIPPGIYGYDESNKKDTKQALEQAKQLLSQAGYPQGINSHTGEQLQINFDAVSSGDPDEKAHIAWLRKQLNKLGIDLVVRSTDYNTFMDKMRTGEAQMFSWGWNADYPDPENFLDQFYGPNGKVKYAGENAANYYNPSYDKLYMQFKSMPDTTARLEVIKQLIEILQHDGPWVWGYFPQTYSLYNVWVKPTKPSGIANNTLKYVRIDPDLRAELRQSWNKAIVWPLIFVFIILILIILPAVIGFKLNQKATGKRLT